MQKIGTVKQINIYPVKSMRGVSVEKATCYWYGLNGDRKLAFVHQDDTSGFPWVTAREIPQLLQYQPELVSPDDPLKSPVVVRTPSGKRLPVDSQELANELLSSYEKPVTLVKLKRGTFDCMPISLLTQTSLDTLQSKLPYTLDARRFRANVVIDTGGGQGYPENDWLNALISFSDRPDSAQILVNYPDERCMMVNLDPETGQSNPDILKNVVKETNGCFSVYASVHKLGTIEVSDAVYLQNHKI
jgi:uncharacterized protein